MRSKHVAVLIGLIVIAGLSFSGAAAAAGVNPPVAGTVGGEAVSEQAVLYDQINNAAGGAVVISQNFESLDSYCAGFGLQPQCMDNQAADDFAVPSGGGVLSWTVNKVEVTGAYESSGYQAVSVNVFFYRDSGSGLPGVTVYQDSYIPESASLASGSFVVNLTRGAVLEVGRTYWVSVQANMNMQPGTRQWRWGSRQVQDISKAAWQNPGNGWLTGCTTWGVLQSVCTTASHPDLLFRLSGYTNNTNISLPLVFNGS
jgi:hypothetical protein